ncbi:MAG: glycosyltransferase [Planctomycetaceae bacterium]|nr:glycosyltransferase [Planctomycetaceae bacterium]
MIEHRIAKLSARRREYLATLLAERRSRQPDPRQSDQLVAWLAVDGQATPSDSELREHLSQYLPAAVIPRHFIRRESLPRTATGKVDRRQLTQQTITVGRSSGSDDGIAGLSADGRNGESPIGVTAGESTQDRLLAIWRDVLGTSRVSVDDNFFDIGGDSLGIIKLIALCRESEIHVTPGVIHEHPTIRDLSSVLSTTSADDVTAVEAVFPNVSPPLTEESDNLASQTSAEPSKFAVPPHQPTAMCLSADSKKPPLFLIPPKGVAVSEFRHIVPHVTEYSCFSPITLERNSANRFTVEELADLFLRQIRSVQPNGAYRLAGTCEGAYIAWVIAGRLVDAGQVVEFLGLIDTPNPVSMKPRPLTERLRLRLQTLDHTSVFGMCRQIARRGASWMRRRAKQTVSREKHLTQAGSRMGWQFSAQPYDGHAVLFRAAKKTEITDFTSDQTHGWGDLPKQGLDICCIPCRRLELLQPPYAEILGRQMQHSVRMRQTNATARHAITTPGPSEREALKPLRILVAADVPPNANSGASGTVFQMNQALRDLGHSVDAVWSTQLGRRIRHGNLHYLLELPRAYRRELRRALRKTDYDVIEFNQPHAWLAARECHRLGFRGVFVNRSHGHEIRFDLTMDDWHIRLGETRSPLRSLATRLMRRRLHRHWDHIAAWADGFVVSCRQDACFLETHQNVARDRIGIVSQGLSAEFTQTPVVAMTNERLNRLLYVGNFAACKAPPAVAESVNMLLTQRSELSMTWVCEAANHPRVRKLISPEHQCRVNLLDWMGQQELAAVMDRCGILIFPSLFEGFGKTPLEAMSRGMCVIASCMGGMPEYIEDGRSGFIIDSGDAKAVFDRATRLLDAPDEARAISQRARHAAEHRTWHACAKEAELFYRRLLGRKTAAGSLSSR